MGIEKKIMGATLGLCHILDSLTLHNSGGATLAEHPVPDFNWIYMTLLQYTWLYLNTPGFTWIGLNLPDLIELTLIYLN